MDDTQSIAQQQPQPDQETPVPLEVGIENLTPVYGTVEPTQGLPRQIRQRAYSIPAHDPRRWVLLLAADRAEAASNISQEARMPERRYLVLRHFSRQARAHSKAYLAGAVLVGGVVLGMITKRVSVAR